MAHICCNLHVNLCTNLALCMLQSIVVRPHNLPNGFHANAEWPFVVLINIK